MKVSSESIVQSLGQSYTIILLPLELQIGLEAKLYIPFKLGIWISPYLIIPSPGTNHSSKFRTLVLSILISSVLDPTVGGTAVVDKAL